MGRMRRSPALAVSALVLTLSLGLAGCSAGGSDAETGSETSSSAPALEATPATGATVTSDGYSYSIPESWAEQDATAAPGADTIALDSNVVGDFANNVNVVLSPNGAFTPDEIEDTVKDELESGGGENVEVHDRLTVAGGETAHVTASTSASGVNYYIHQYYLTNDDQTYVVTFSFGETVPDEEAVDIAESILASWTWS
jgi:hypothetical protein